MSSSTKTPSRWDALGSDRSSRDYDRGTRRQRRPNMGELIEREEKWVNDKPGKQYIRAPDTNSTRQFPSLGPSASEAGAGAGPSTDYAALSFSEEPVPSPALDEHAGMVGLRAHKASASGAASEQDDCLDLYPDPYLSHDDMFWCIEDMKTRWSMHNELQGTFINYDHIPDTHGLDTWDTDSGSDISESEDEYDAV